MTKDEALRLALDTLKEVRDETFRLLRNGEKLYAEDKVWSTIISIQETLEKKDEQRTWVGLTKEEIDQGLLRSPYALQSAGAWREGIEWATEQLKEKNT
jgi:hypothetical protein